VKILFFTDPHNAERAPRSRVETYMEDLLDKQEQLIEPAKKCDLVIHGGDVFHSKKPASFKLWNKLAEIYRELGNLIILAGNHDFDKTHEELEWNHVYALNKLPNVDVVLQAEVVNRGVRFIFFGGGDYFSFEEFKKYLNGIKKQSVFSVGVFHSSIKVAKKKYPFPTISLSTKFFDLFNLILLGHLHDQQFHGAVKKSGQSLYVAAPGSLSRGVLREDESLDRAVGYSLITVKDKNTEKVEFKKLKYKKAEDVFDLEAREEEKQAGKKAQDLIDYVENMELSGGLDNDYIINKIKNMDIEVKVKEKAIEILEGLL